MSKRTILHISSKDRVVGSSSSFLCRFKPISDVAFSVNSVELPNTFYNICDNNNRLVIEVAEVQSNVDIKSGYYSRTELGTAIADGISTALTIAATFTEDSKKNLITFTTPATNMKIVYATSTIAEVLGISADTTSASTTTTGFINLGFNAVLIQSTITSHVNTQSNTNAVDFTIYKHPLDQRWQDM